MNRRTKTALTGAALGALLLVLTWTLAFHVSLFERADQSILKGFLDLSSRQRINRIAQFIADLCNPSPYVYLAAVPLIVALVRRRARVFLAMGAILLGANVTTQLLKPLLAGPRDYVQWVPLGEHTWPSGHATAAMALALCSVIAAPPRRRPVVAAAMAAFAIAVSYSFLELAWHYPSDVLGGFLVAGTWTLLGVASLSILEVRRAGPVSEAARPRRPSFSVGEALAPVGLMAAAAAVLVGLIVLARPHEVVSYVSEHHTFVIGAGGIGVLGMLLASGLTLMLRRN